MECKKCENCPLNESEHPHCPIAVKVVDLVNFFCQPHPYKDVDVTIETPERTYSKNIDLKTASVSLLGIYMVTSGCPIMDKLRPMARFHLPFATTIETTYRSITNYLIAQYLLSHEGKDPDWELKSLAAIYEDVGTVNACFRQRLQEVSSQSYALNALFTLDSYTNYISMSIDGDAFYNVETLFNKEFDDKIIETPTEEETDPSDKLAFQYRFHLANDDAKSFCVNLHRENLRLLNKQTNDLRSFRI